MNDIFPPPEEERPAFDWWACAVPALVIGLGAMVVVLGVAYMVIRAVTDHP